jgi:uncharacterized protein YhaN
LTEIEEQRRVLREEERGLRRRRVALQENLSALERIERAERLREIEALMHEIDEVTKRCFALGAVREFPLDRLRDVQRTENAMANTKAQLTRMRKERGDLAQQLETEKERLGPGSDAALADIPEDVENRLAELESKIVRLRDRFDEAKATRDSAEERFKAAQETLARVPDFSPMSPDPMEWLTQLSSSLRVVQRARDEECGQRDRLNQDIDRRRAALSGPQRVFVGCENFPDMAREYEMQRHDMDDQIAYLSNRIESLNADAEEGLDRIPDFRKMTILSGVLLCVLLGAAAYTGNMAPLFPAALTALALFYFAGNLLYIHDGARRAERDMGKLHDETARLQRLGTEHGHTIEKMMRGADCQTLRELEALYEQYRDNNRELTGLEETAKAQEARAREAEIRLAQLLDKHRKMFQSMNVPFKDESQLDEATRLAIARYQEYRDAKRRNSEGKEVFEKRQKEMVRIEEELNALLKEDRDLSLQVRQQMRDSGYAEESKADSALRALRSYRIRAAQIRERRGRIELMEENLAGLDRQLKAEEEVLSGHEAVMTACLKDAGVASIEDWHACAEQARDYQEVWDKRMTLEKQVESLLRNQDLPSLRAQVEADGPIPERPEGNIEAIKTEIQWLAEQIDAKQKEEHALHIVLTERTAGTRSLNQIEEERDATARRAELLDIELRAASYAMAQIEDVAQDKHSRIAPRLASIASGYLSEITGGAYSELLINRELQISVRIPQTRRMDKEPEQRLSTGTVDQIYLSLRLAMVGILSENRESIPMLLDDPFANYDDERLERTMALLANIAKKHQVLLFTCREDVVRTARQVEAGIIEL